MVQYLAADSEGVDDLLRDLLNRAYSEMHDRLSKIHDGNLKSKHTKMVCSVTIYEIITSFANHIWLLGVTLQAR